MTINVITGSDFHYGASDPIQLTHEIENVFIKKIEEVRPEIVAITGDWWHKRLHSDSIPYQKSIQTLLKIATIVTSYGGYFRFVKGTLTHDLETPETLKYSNITKNCNISY
jgi:predicted MPP superfamily phosphohydrolase